MAKVSTNRGAARLDQFPNFYKASIYTSVADTVNYQEWNTGFSIKDGYGFVLHKIEYMFRFADLANLNADTDKMVLALVTNNTVTGAQAIAGVADNIIDQVTFGKHQATAVGIQIMEPKIVHDFTNEPGGGRIFAPKPLYWLTYSEGLGAVFNAYVRAVYTMIKLTEQMYRELYESMNPSA